MPQIFGLEWDDPEDRQKLLMIAAGGGGVIILLLVLSRRDGGAERTVYLNETPGGLEQPEQAATSDAELLAQMEAALSGVREESAQGLEGVLQYTQDLALSFQQALDDMGRQVNTAISSLGWGAYPAGDSWGAYYPTAGGDGYGLDYSLGDTSEPLMPGAERLLYADPVDVFRGAGEVTERAGALGRATFEAFAGMLAFAPQTAPVRAASTAVTASRALGRLIKPPAIRQRQLFEGVLASTPRAATGRPTTGIASVARTSTRKPALTPRATPTTRPTTGIASVMRTSTPRKTTKRRDTSGRLPRSDTRLAQKIL